MLRIKPVVALLFALSLVFGFAGRSHAGPNMNGGGLNLAELAAGVAIPFVTEIGMITTAVITNTASSDRQLHFDLLNGDPDEGWEVQSWNCTLTARETMQIVFAEDVSVQVLGLPDNVSFECDGIEGDERPYTPNAGNDGAIATVADRGVLWVTIQNVNGESLGDNVLFADFSLIDVLAGTLATAPAAGFQVGSSGNDGNHKYDFDGVEYSRFPAALATNYLPPDTYAGKLLVFTLDGIPGLAPKARARVLWYNDDEDYEDDAFTFACMDLIDYGDIADGLDELDTAGHMEILPVLEPNTQKKVPFLCYNIQDGLSPAGDLAGTSMRPCAQSTATFSRTPEPSLDTQL